MINFQPQKEFVDVEDERGEPEVPHHDEVDVPAAVARETVKCSNVPYIMEEQEILQNINIVRNVKNMFVK